MSNIQNFRYPRKYFYPNGYDKTEITDLLVILCDLSYKLE